MSATHALTPSLSHDERAEQTFVRDFRLYLANQVQPLQKTLAEAAERDGVATAPALLAESELTRCWFGYRRTIQDMMWDAVGDAIDRQIDTLEGTAAAVAAKGSLTLDADFVAPSYLRKLDVHRMPGGYDHDDGGIRQGALTDAGGAVFMLGRNGGGMNDGRGHTLVAHLFDLYPDLAPQRVLELGCGVGASTCAVAGYFPDAEIHAVDVGASLLRYAHARAELLGHGIHFSEQNAEHTTFADESFDVVYSCALVHETSHAAFANILEKCHRLLKPGGIMAHVEVPTRPDVVDLWANLQIEFESRCNNEPFWRGSQLIDFDAQFRASGFCDIAVGFRPPAARAERGVHAFITEKPAPGAGFGFSWFVASARK